MKLIRSEGYVIGPRGEKGRMTAFVSYHQDGKKLNDPTDSLRRGDTSGRACMLPDGTKRKRELPFKRNRMGTRGGRGRSLRDRGSQWDAYRAETGVEREKKEGLGVRRRGARSRRWRPGGSRNGPHPFPGEHKPVKMALGPKGPGVRGRPGQAP